ncbi:MAG: DUF1670 domain-containing protein [Anaerolineales bacterium]|nr:DUF1670 domain-containing protein [Anaerolineales bacterium]
MRRRGTHRQETFSPLRDKTLTSVLRHIFVTEFGYEKSVIFAEAAIERILETIEAFVKPASLLKPGQLLWMAVAHDGHKHTHQAMKEIPQVPVILDLVTDEDLQALANGEDFRIVRRSRHARLLEQSLAQLGVLAQGDLAAITLTSQRQVSEDITRFQKAHGCILPYRGSVQDVGATLTHKVEVARLLEAGYLEPDICRMLSPAHTLRSVENYAQTYKKVMKLLEHGFAPDEISGILGIGKRLVNAYIEIIREHHPEIIANHPYLRERPDNPGSSST